MATDAGFLAAEGRAAYLDAADALVVADLHLGRAAASNVSFPLGERSESLDRLASALDRFDPATVVVAGDLLHAFESIPHGVEDAVAAVEETVAAAGADLAVTPGNHDAMLDAVYGGRREPAIRLADGTVVCHGHEEPPLDADRYVVGHEHPAIAVEGDRRHCFLYGPRTYRGADVLVCPAFSALAAGTVVNDLRTTDALSPLVTDVSAFRLLVPAVEETLAFPPLGELRRFL